MPFCLLVQVSAYSVVLQRRQGMYGYTVGITASGLVWMVDYLVLKVGIAYPKGRPFALALEYRPQHIVMVFKNRTTVLCFTLRLLVKLGVALEE